MEAISRRKLRATGGGAAVLGAVLAPAVSAQERPIRSPWAFTVDIALDAAPAMALAGPFFVGGKIFKGLSLGGDGTPPSTARVTGTYRSWGWAYDPARLPRGGGTAADSFDISASPDGGEGELVAEGLLDRRFPVVAGKGRFRSANGQAEITWLSPTAFRVAFDIEAAP